MTNDPDQPAVEQVPRLQVSGAFFLVLATLFIGLFLGGRRWALVAPLATLGLVLMLIGVSVDRSGEEAWMASMGFPPTADEFRRGPDRPGIEPTLIPRTEPLPEGPELPAHP